MNKAIISLLTVIILSCTVSKKNTQKNSIITLTGIAKNAKYSAVLLLDEDKFYYVSDFDSWPDTLYNKLITLRGYYFIEKERKKKVNGFVLPYIPKKNVLKDVEILSAINNDCE